MAAPKGLKLTPAQRRAIAKAETDQAIRRLMKRERLAAGLNVKVLGQLKRLERDAVAKLTAYDPEDLSFRARRLRRLKREVGEEIKARYRAIQDEVHAELKGLAADEGAWKAKTIGESYASVGASLEPALAPKAVLEAMASRPVVLGATAAEFWGKQGQDLADRFGREMQIGVGAGEGLGKLVQRVRGTKANSYSDGVMALSRRHAETLVRTSTNSVANAAHEAVYAANADIIAGVMQQSVLDGRTSMVCMGRHGLKWKLDGTPIGGHGKPYRRPPLHFACRSVLISLPIGTNAEDDIPNTEFGEWFDGLDDDAQDDLFGPGRAKLWREGRIKQATLLDQRGRPMTLEALRGKASPEPPANTPLSSPPDGASLQTVKPIIDSNANSVKARIADVDETIQTSWGGNLQARAGKDYILEYGDDDFGVVRADIFEDTYIRARGKGRFRKNPDVTIQYWITDKPRKIRTLEGVVDASPGDHVMVGTRGEMWPVKPEKFAARYRSADQFEARSAGRGLAGNASSNGTSNDALADWKRSSPYYANVEPGHVANRGVAKARDAVQKGMRKQGVEHAEWVNGKGRRVWSARGSKNNVSIAGSEKHLGDENKWMELVHSHPAEAGLSPGDIAVISKTQNAGANVVRRISAYTPQGGHFVAQVNVRDIALSRAMESFLASPRFAEIIAKNGLTLKNGDAIFWHAMPLALRRMGLIAYEYRVSDDIAEFLVEYGDNRLDKLIADIEIFVADLMKKHAD